MAAASVQNVKDFPTAMMDRIKPFLEKLEKELAKDNQFTQYLGQAEKASGLKKLHIVLIAFGIFAFIFTLCFGGDLLINLIGFLYPAYKSVMAIESKESDDDTQWLIYWVVFSYITFMEYFIDIILWWFPLYYTLKLAVLIWCMAPTSMNGSVVLYNQVIRPFVLNHQKTIETIASEVADAAEDLGAEMAADIKEKANDEMNNQLRQRATEAIKEQMSNAE